MNPESLAGRLGPELVRELENLLKPGVTEMPSFSVRQEIQQRYNIDRRHIYDWFHNKGLRVTTSEQREERRALRVNGNIHVPTTRTMVGLLIPPTPVPVYLRTRNFVLGQAPSLDGGGRWLSDISSPRG